MRRKPLGMAAVAALLVLAATACEPKASPWHVELVSVNEAGTAPGNGWAGRAVWSADGTAVAFASTSTDLAPGDPDDRADVYVRDLDAGVTTLASPHPASGGSSLTVVDALSADGTRVLFHSTRDSLTSLPDVNGGYDYFLRDLVAGTTTVVSVNTGGTATGNGDSAPRHAAFMTPDGTRVAFTSMASDLVPGGAGGGTIGLYVRDLAAGTTTLVADNVGEPQGFSADGTKVLFPTSSPLVPEDGNGDFDLYVRDVAAATTTLVSVNAAGTGAGDRGTWLGSLTPDGDRALFTSASSDLVTDVVDANGLNDVFLRDLATGTTRLVSTDASGTASGEGKSSEGVLSPDGSTAVYRSDTSAGSFDPDEMDLFAKDLATGSVTLVSPREPGGAGGTGLLIPVGFTADGRAVVFTSDADNFGPADENGESDVYAHDLVSGATHLVSAGRDGTQAALGGSRDAVVSPVGRRVLFLSAAGDLVPGGSGATNVLVGTLRLADLVVGGNVDASGGELTYELTVSNGGPDGVEAANLAFALPEGTTFSGATTTAGTCEEAQPRIVTCALGDAETGVVADVTVTATVQAPGSPLEAVAAVTSATYESDADDNVVTLTSTVG
jgi:uncharacterized repeat protein (TIGR01451 family)